MKTASMFGLALLPLSLLAGPSVARAGNPGGLGTWQGSGSAHATSGADLGRFSIVLERRLVGDKVRGDGKITLEDGRVITFWQENEDAGGGAFRMTSSNGTGGGRCFANGMCQTYEERPDGHAFSTTIAIDGPDKLRILVTELEKGKAVKFMDQTLTKK